MKNFTKMMLPKSVMFFVMLSVMALSGFAQVSHYVHHDETIQIPPTRSGMVIYDQMNEVSTNGISSQQFTDDPTYSCQGADDFIVPAGITWNIHYIDVAGFFDVQGNAVNAVNVIVYADDNGIPGSEVFSAQNITSVNELPLSSLVNKLEIALPTAIILTEGHYWLSIQAVGEFGSIGPWRWCEHVGLTVENEYHWRNPSDGFGSGMIDWTAASMFSFGYFNLAFAFHGPAFADDLSCLWIESPITAPEMGSNEPVTIMLKNEGTNPQSGFNISYSVDGGAAVTENVGVFTLFPNQASLYTFNTTADFSTPGPREITAYVNLATDANHQNDTSAKSFYNLGTIYPMPSAGTSSITSCGGTFTDSGGLEGDFGINDNATTTIYPATAGDRVKLNFLTFDVSWGGLSVYDGIDMNAPLLGTWFGSNNVPGELSALNPTGALTVHFESPGWETRPGWSAFISCYTPATDDFVAITIKCSLPTMFTGDNAVLSAKVQNYGTLSQSKTVTFKANDVVIATQQTPVLNPGDTAWVSVPFSPVVAGDYNLSASLPADLGAIPNETVSMEMHVYPFGTFYDDFEASVFPSENWRHGGNWSQGDEPAVGSYSASCYVPFTTSDTLVSPRLDIHNGDILNFYAKTTPWWIGDLHLHWMNELNGEWNYMQTIPVNGSNYTQYSIDMSQAAGVSRVGFFVNVTDPFSWAGKILVDNVIGEGITLHRDDYDLKAKAFTGNTFYNVNEESNFQFVVRNDGLVNVSASAYTIKLMKNGSNPVELLSIPGQDLAAQQETTFDIPFTFHAIENLSVFAVIEYTADQYPANNKSAMITLTGLAGSSVVVPVGNDVFAVSWPVDFSYKKSLSETIYQNTEINQTGVLFGIEYDYKFIAPETIVPVRIWVGETEATELFDWVPATGLTLVYDGLLNYQAGVNKIYIPFEVPFNYSDGTKNLVIMTEKIDDHYLTGQDFYAYLGNLNSSIGMSGDEVIPDPYAPSGGWPTVINPNIRFVFNNNVGSMQGTVTVNGGNELEGVQVMVDELGITTTTNASGEYAMPYIPEGDYQVTADKFEYLPVTKPAAIAGSNATTVNFVLELLDLLAVTGRVVGNDNPSVGIAGATVTLTGYSNYSTVTDAQGYFSLQNVYSNNTYELEISQERYEIYTGQAVLVTTALNLGNIVLIEKLVIAYSLTAEDKVEKVRLTWYTPDITAQGILQFDDGMHSNGYAGEPNEEVWLGNYFPVTGKSTVTSFDVYWAGYGLNVKQPMRLDIFDDQTNLIASSNEFISGIDNWVNVDVPNLTLLGDYYVMIHWSGNFAQSTFLGFDTTSAATPDHARYMYPGGSPQHLSDITGEYGTFLIHANAMIANKKSPGSTTAVTGFNIYRGLVSDIANAANWPKLNASPGISIVYEDLTWPPTTNGNYIYAVKALYNAGESELAFSNILPGIYAGSEELPGASISVYPNPASDYVTIQNCRDSQITLYSTDGKMILRTESQNECYNMDVRRFPKGMYMLNIRSDSFNTKQKLIIQ